MSNDTFTWHDLEQLVDETESPCVTIYLPTHRAGAETQEDPIRLKNLLRDAEAQLAGGEMRPTLARDMLAPAQALVDDYQFWQHQSDGLALFCSPSGVRRYRLPLRFDELAVVAPAFHIKPLLKILSQDGQFYVLAVSGNDVRLWAATRYAMDEIELPASVPRSQAEALRYDDPERQSQFHTGAPQQGQRRGAVFFGHGGESESAKADLLRYFQAIDRGLREVLGDARAPLVLAAVDYLHPIFREASSYPGLLDEGVVGSPEQVRPEELHSRAWELVEPRFSEARNASIDRYHASKGSGRSSADLSDIVRAASQGRVDTLFVAVGVQEWGSYDQAANTLVKHEQPEDGDRDLLDVCAVQTLAHGGEVYAVDPGAVPDDGTVAAILRY